ncbi:uncharacterized protein LOC123317216 [Coccinella septempunctata]|uniref:uncharacterized protein LOC123317216 n=1 Tax=Coccinella septempunctata TaxID=41139 RepID=UPI001D07EB35|nr:uncharacterized protein LOC123317216 [Coccinella septempunctata]
MMKKIYSSTPIQSVKVEEVGPSEKKLAYYGVILALCVIATKLYFLNEEHIKRFIFETKLITYEQVVTDGEIMLTYAWKTSIRYSRYWISLLCGALVTYFTWLMVYLDSKDPGNVPPSPFSPKQKYSYIPVFHLNYAFGLLMGILVASFCYIKGFSLEY